MMSWFIIMALNVVHSLDVYSKVRVACTDPIGDL